MEFISGISKKEYVSIKELAQGSCDGKTEENADPETSRKR